MEATEQDAAIRAGKGGGLSAIRLYRLRITMLKEEDDQWPNRLVIRLSAALWRNLLRARGGVAFFALAIRPAAATRPLNFRAGALAARVGCSKRFGRNGCSLTATTASAVLRRCLARVGRYLRLNCAAA